MASRRRSGARVAAALLLAAAASGCSLAFVDAPPRGYRDMDSFRCTEGNAVPVLDALWAGASALGAINAWAEPTTPDRAEIMLLGSGMALAAAASSTVGFRRRNACRAARVEMSRARLSRPPAAPESGRLRMPEPPPAGAFRRPGPASPPS